MKNLKLLCGLIALILAILVSGKILPYSSTMPYIVSSIGGICIISSFEYYKSKNLRSFGIYAISSVFCIGYVIMNII